MKKSKRSEIVEPGMIAKRSTTHIIQRVIVSMAMRSMSIPGIQSGAIIHTKVTGISAVASNDKAKLVNKKTIELIPK